jgi:hypothetical protein
LVAAIEERLGEGVVVRSDDVDGNQVSGATWPLGGGGHEHPYVALFTDDGEVIGCTIGPAGG